LQAAPHCIISIGERDPKTGRLQQGSKTVRIVTTINADWNTEALGAAATLLILVLIPAT
jgi:hypothetical protein